MTPARCRVEITPIGEIAPATLHWLAAELETQFPWTRCVAARPFASRDEWWEANTGRLWVDQVLDSLVEWHAAQGHDLLRHWLLGVTPHDLAAPGLSFAFGEATVGGCCAVISLARLRTPGPDPAAERALLRLRMLKEACHELGHVLGLPHCERAVCVMSPSSGIAAIDRKSSDFCSVCAAALEPLLRERS